MWTDLYKPVFVDCGFFCFRLDNVNTIDIIRLIVPDVVVFATGLVVYIICYKLLPEEKSSAQQLPTVVKSRKTSAIDGIIHFIGETILVIFLAACGIIAPSALSAVYFVSFLFLATLWSLYGHLGAKFSVFRVVLLVYSAAHILVLHLYQFQFFQEFLAPGNFIAR